MHFAAGKPPQEETVDSPERKPAILRGAPRPLHMIEQPTDLRC